MSQLDLFFYFSAAIYLILSFLVLLFILHTYYLRKTAKGLKYTLYSVMPGNIIDLETGLSKEFIVISFCVVSSITIMFVVYFGLKSNNSTNLSTNSSTNSLTSSSDNDDSLNSNNNDDHDDDGANIDDNYVDDGNGNYYVDYDVYPVTTENDIKEEIMSRENDLQGVVNYLYDLLFSGTQLSFETRNYILDWIKDNTIILEQVLSDTDVIKVNEIIGKLGSFLIA